MQEPATAPRLVEIATLVSVRPRPGRSSAVTLEWRADSWQGVRPTTRFAAAAGAYDP